MREWAKMLVGGIIVYAVMAACGGAPNQDSQGRPIVSNALDAMSEPVKEAMAQAPPQISNVLCDKSYPDPNNPPGMRYYAQQAYPGKSASDLARVVAMLKIDPVDTGLPPGTQYRQEFTFIRDGFVAVWCPPNSSALFILPAQ
jgi:hypothetical protein